MVEEFNTGNHAQLLSSFENIGFRAIPYELMRFKRQQSGKIGNDISEDMSIDISVPQGTDNTAMFCMNNSLENLKSLIQKYFKKICNYFYRKHPAILLYFI